MQLFKNYNMNQWMEQLFKHEGVCVWGWDIYYNMKEVRESINANACELVGYDDYSNPMYVALKPGLGGNIIIGLYNEDKCYTDYTGDKTVEEACSGYQPEEEEHNEDHHRRLKGNPCQFYNYMDYFNYAFDEWKLCQPCTSYDLKNNFECNDDAGYTNCMQCMKFRNKADSVPAGINDIRLASRQSGITQIDICGVSYGSGGYGTSMGPVSLETAVSANVEAVTIYKVLSGQGKQARLHDGSVFFLLGSIFIAFAVTIYFFEINLVEVYKAVSAKVLETSSELRKRRSQKKDPLLDPNDEGVMS